MKILKTFDYVFDFHLDELNRKECLKELNEHITGDTSVNIWDGKKYVPKYPEKESKLQSAHRNLHIGRRFKVKMYLMEDGNISQLDKSMERACNELIDAIQSVQDWNGTYVGECIDKLKSFL